MFAQKKHRNWETEKLRFRVVWNRQSMIIIRNDNRIIDTIINFPRSKLKPTRFPFSHFLIFWHTMVRLIATIIKTCKVFYRLLIDRAAAPVWQPLKEKYFPNWGEKIPS